MLAPLSAIGNSLIQSLIKIASDVSLSIVLCHCHRHPIWRQLWENRCENLQRLVLRGNLNWKSECNGIDDSHVGFSLLDKRQRAMDGYWQLQTAIRRFVIAVKAIPCEHSVKCLTISQQTDMLKLWTADRQQTFTHINCRTNKKKAEREDRKQCKLKIIN